MAYAITFTCVPLGKAGNEAVLEVLVTPTCDGQNQIQQIMKWADFVLNHKSDFALTTPGANGTDSLISKLKLTNESIESSLWNSLFRDAVATAPGAKEEPTAIAPGGVSLSTTHQLAHEFLASAHSRTPQLGKHAPNHSWLNSLHTDAVARHGAYLANKSANASIPSDLAAAGRADAIIKVLDTQGGTAAIQAAAITHGRFATAVGAAGSVEQSAVEIPDRAREALAYVQLHTVNSIKTAGKQSVITVPGNPPAPRHLIPHVNRLISSATRTNAFATANAATLGQPTYTFNQRITMLLSAPALLQALGLVLRFNFDAAKIPAECDIKLQVPPLDFFKTNDGVIPAKVQRLTHTNTRFLPKPDNAPGNSAIAIRDDGWLVPTADYGIGSLQLDSSAMLITQFSNQAGLRQAKADGTKDGRLQVTISHDEDVDHSILPPSMHTGGLQVWHEGLQEKVIQQRSDARALQSNNQPLYAEDLRNGIVVDVLAIPPGVDSETDPRCSWLALCKVSEKYRIEDKEILAERVDRSVKTAATRVSNPVATDPLSHEVDETLFVWRDGSLVAKSRPPQISDRPSSKVPPTLPWTQFSKADRQPSDALPPPYFDWKYRYAMRASFVTGGCVPFDPAKDGSTALAAALPAHPFQRYELLQGPISIPVFDNKYEKDESPNLLYVGSEVTSDLGLKSASDASLRLLVPAQVAESVAQRHNMDPDKISVGATILALDKGTLPAVIGPDSGYNEEDADPDFKYLPDPMCQGLVAVLTDISGKSFKNDQDSLTTTINFFTTEDDWPNYAPHLVELRRSSAAEPSIHVEDIEVPYAGLPVIQPGKSKVIVCNIPAGQTYLLHLYPSFWPSNSRLHAGQHALTALSNLSEDLLPFSDMCRPTVLRLTHATDRPNVKPVLTCTGNVACAPSISVDPTGSFMLGITVNAEGTSKVAIRATWTEFVDDIGRSHFASTKTAAQLLSLHVSKRNKSGSSSTKDPGILDPVKMQFPFNDGRHRSLRVVASGVSRYGSIVSPGDDSAHTTVGDPITAHILATKPPMPPDIEYVLPNFRWTKIKGGRTRTSGLTLVLNRPWFTSGEGEQLAVLTSRVTDMLPTATIATSFKNAGEENIVSAWGVMQDWFPTAPSGTSQELITIAEDTARDGSDKNAPYSKDLPKQGTVQIGDGLFSALFFTPRYNSQDGQWYVNLALSKPPAYGAVVRLVVARYQANAVAGKQISSPSVCEFSVLRPERSVVVSRSGWFGSKKRVQIFGVATPVPKDDKLFPQSIFEVGYYDQNDGSPTGFNYRRVKEVTGSVSEAGNSQLLWEGTFKEIIPGGKLVVQEREVWPSAEGLDATDTIPVYSDIIQL